MKIFWLSQRGDAPTGPLLISQLKALAQKGQLVAEDLVCEDGSEDWQPVTAVLGELPANTPPPALDRPRPMSDPRQEGWRTEDESPPQKERSEWLLWTMAGVLALAAAVGSWLYFFADHHESLLPPSNLQLSSKVREWLQLRVATGDARVEDIGPAMSWSDGELRVVHYMVGLGSQTIVLRFNTGSRDVNQGWSPQDWLDIYSKSPAAARYPGTVRIISDAAKTSAPGN